MEKLLRFSVAARLPGVSYFGALIALLGISFGQMFEVLFGGLLLNGGLISLCLLVAIRDGGGMGRYAWSVVFGIPLLALLWFGTPVFSTGFDSHPELAVTAFGVGMLLAGGFLWSVCSGAALMRADMARDVVGLVCEILDIEVLDIRSPSEKEWIQVEVANAYLPGMFPGFLLVVPLFAIASASFWEITYNHTLGERTLITALIATILTHIMATSVHAVVLSTVDQIVKGERYPEEVREPEEET